MVAAPEAQSGGVLALCDHTLPHLLHVSQQVTVLLPTQGLHVRDGLPGQDQPVVAGLGILIFDHHHLVVLVDLRNGKTKAAISIGSK